MDLIAQWVGYAALVTTALIVAAMAFLEIRDRWDRRQIERRYDDYLGGPR